MKHCQICGTPFLGGAPNKKYCSRRCRQKAFAEKERTRDAMHARDPLRVGSLNNPTLGELKETAQALRNAPFGATVTLTGVIPVADGTEIDGATVACDVNGMWFIARMTEVAAPAPMVPHVSARSILDKYLPPQTGA